jgi:phosphotransferase system  glucose/maltose/N-acetylglucosamine-specific IIC component
MMPIAELIAMGILLRIRSGMAKMGDHLTGKTAIPGEEHGQQ